MKRPSTGRGDREAAPEPPREPAPEVTLDVSSAQLPVRASNGDPDRAPAAPASSQAPAAAAAEAPPRKVSVGPDDVFQAGPILRGRWREHSFFAPILLVVLVSAALVYGGVAAVGIVLRLLR